MSLVTCRIFCSHRNEREQRSVSFPVENETGSEAWRIRAVALVGQEDYAAAAEAFGEGLAVHAAISQSWYDFVQMLKKQDIGLFFCLTKNREPSSIRQSVTRCALTCESGANRSRAGRTEAILSAPFRRFSLTPALSDRTVLASPNHLPGRHRPPMMPVRQWFLIAR